VSERRTNGNCMKEESKDRNIETQELKIKEGVHDER
jgi:hypothetical protein